MTYPGTKIREHTALESGLIQRVSELENERDELVKLVRDYALIINGMHMGKLPTCFKPSLETLNEVNRLLAKYPK
jgi:hypothetical protein